MADSIPVKVIINKKVGETPLEALENFRREQIGVASDSELKSKWESIPMTYAGRLDPMAEGVLIFLIGDECKNKDKYLKMDKEYEVEIVFGMSTDTYDALGLVMVGKAGLISEVRPQYYVGKFNQPYPAYSSKTVNGKQLHELARADQLPEEMPKNEVEIYSIELLDEYSIDSQKLQARIIGAIDQVKGDFRQVEIKNRWNDVLNDSQQSFQMIKIKVSCSSGTYMRSLAQKIGEDLGVGAFALSIKRTKIVEK